MTLILGGSGQVGTAFRRLLPDAIAPNRRHLDLIDTGEIRSKIRALRPNRIINCAAYTAVDAAEEDEETANRINGEAVGELAVVAHELGIPFVTFSTDYVFDGETDEPYTEASKPNPVNAYGRSKLLGETAALCYPGSLVVRTSWLFSATHPNFVATILSKATKGEVRVVDDQWGSPTPVPELAAMTLRAVDNGMSGLLHIAGAPPTTWFRLAREACVAAGILPGRVVPCSSDESPRQARRPRRAVLTTTSTYQLPDWRDELGSVVGMIMYLDGTGSGLPSIRDG
jgi:dTDP-4-dehydrorhamnose reductase